MSEDIYGDGGRLTITRKSAGRGRAPVYQVTIESPDGDVAYTTLTLAELDGVREAINREFGRRAYATYLRETRERGAG
jgi:hypothetical protein